MIKDGCDAKKDLMEYLANRQTDTHIASEYVDEMYESDPEIMSKIQNEVEAAIEHYCKLKKEYDDDEYDYYINLLKGFLEICKESEEEENNVVSFEDFKEKHSRGD